MIIPKWIDIRDPKELKQCQNKNTASQISNDNQLKAYLLSHFDDVNSISDTESVVKSEAKSNNRNVDKTDLFLALLATKDEAQKKQ